MTVINGDRRRSDASKLARGRPSTTLVKDMNIRRALEANNQNIEFLLRKVKDIRKPLPGTKSTDVTKVVKKKVILNPTVVILPAVAGITTAFTLNGIVNPNGIATTAYFEYGLTTNYGAQISVGSMGSGTIAVPVSAIVSLNPDTQYHCRLVGQNANGGWAFSYDLLIETGLVPTCTIYDPIPLAASTASLIGTVNPEGLATTYHFAYGDTPEMTLSTPDVAIGNGEADVSASADITSLAFDTTYYSQLKASNFIGEGKSEVLKFRTKKASIPVILPASNIGLNQADLNCWAYPEGLDTTGYFEYGPTTAYGMATPIYSVGSGTGQVTVTDTVLGLATHGTYHFRFVQTNSAGTLYSDDAVLTTAVGPATGSVTAVRKVYNNGVLTATDTDVFPWQTTTWLYDLAPGWAKIPGPSMDSFADSSKNFFIGISQNPPIWPVGQLTVGYVWALAVAWDDGNDWYASGVDSEGYPTGTATWTITTDESGLGLGPFHLMQYVINWYKTP